MVLRAIKKVGIFLLSFLLIFSLTSCDLDSFFSDVELNVSSNGEVNSLYFLLEQFYYEKLPLNLTKIDEVEELFKYTDPYTYLYKKDTRSIEMGDEYVGLGLTIADHPLGLLVTDININTDIDEVIYVGDIILKVNGETLNNYQFEDKTLFLKGEEGEVKEMVVRRMNDELTIERPLATIPYNSISYQLIEDTIGYIIIERFSLDTSEKFLEALEALEAEDITSLIIDVRNNGGGYLTAVTEILENFIVDDEPYLYIYDVKSGEEEPYYSPLEEAKPYQIVTLVNNNSASASEVLAGTLKKYGYPVYGEKTYGKDVFQVGIPLGEVFPKMFNDDDILNVTAGYWLLKDKTRVTGGLYPTITQMQTGVLSLTYPALLQNQVEDNTFSEVVYKKGDAHQIIKTYQYLLNALTPFYYQPGYFDAAMATAVLNFQQLNDLEPTGILDGETQILLIDYYRTLIKDNKNDHQLASLINYLSSDDN